MSGPSETCIVAGCRKGAHCSLVLEPGKVTITGPYDGEPAGPAAYAVGQRIGGLCEAHASGVMRDSGEGWTLVQHLTRPEVVELREPWGEGPPWHPETVPVI